MIIFRKIYITFNCMGCQVDAINSFTRYQDDHTFSYRTNISRKYQKESNRKEI